MNLKRDCKHNYKKINKMIVNFKVHVYHILGNSKDRMQLRSRVRLRDKVPT